MAAYTHVSFGCPQSLTAGTMWQLFSNPWKRSWRLLSQLFPFPLQKFVNNIPLDGKFIETKNGMLIGVSQVLQIQKNRCTANTTTIQRVMMITKELTTFSQGFSTYWTKLMNSRRPMVSLPRGWDSSLWSDPRWASCEMGHDGDWHLLTSDSISNAADLQLLCTSHWVHLLGLSHSASHGAGWCRDSQILRCGRRIQPGSCMPWPQASLGTAVVYLGVLAKIQSVCTLWLLAIWRSQGQTEASQPCYRKKHFTALHEGTPGLQKALPQLRDSGELYHGFSLGFFCGTAEIRPCVKSLLADLRVTHYDFSSFVVLSHGDKYIFVPASSLYSTICYPRLVSLCDMGRGHTCDLSSSLCSSQNAAGVTRGSSVLLELFLWWVFDSCDISQSVCR